MDRRLDSLDPRFKDKAMELIARLTEKGIPLLIVNTRRTPQEQADAIKTGHSWIEHSKHLDGLAIDVVPYDVYQLTGPDKLQWNIAHPVWQEVGEVGERIGLRWGGRWIVKDMGHFELVV